jgi:hypothetical protein
LHLLLSHTINAVGGLASDQEESLPVISQFLEDVVNAVLAFMVDEVQCLLTIDFNHLQLITFAIEHCLDQQFF